VEEHRGRAASGGGGPAWPRRQRQPHRIGHAESTTCSLVRVATCVGSDQAFRDGQSRSPAAAKRWRPGERPLFKSRPSLLFVFWQSVAVLRILLVAAACIFMAPGASLAATAQSATRAVAVRLPSGTRVAAGAAIVQVASTRTAGGRTGHGLFIDAPHTRDVIRISSFADPKWAARYRGAVRPY
jgi:hypothetical protein